MVLLACEVVLKWDAMHGAVSLWMGGGGGDVGWWSLAPVHTSVNWIDSLTVFYLVDICTSLTEM